jgi:protein farnesyltransferase/geranylgeranyltransferase type-1 subunit alpha
MSGDCTSNELYKNRKEWKDIEPIYNSVAEDSVVAIALRDEFLDAFAYLRAVMNKREVSERAFLLTTECTRLNPANYSVWEYRRFLLRELKKDLKEELDFCEESIQDNLKNYKVWHHRREIISWIGEKKIDMEFINSILQEDPKNYHAWQHRVFLVRHFDVSKEAELRCTTEFISRDVFNNSAWTFRYFIIAEMSDNFENAKILDDEIKFSLTYIKAAVNNASSWSYLSGLMDFSSYSEHPEIIEFAKECCIADGGKELDISNSAEAPHALAFLAESNMALVDEKKATANSLQTARACYERLIVVDPIRRRLWNHKLHELCNLNAGSV